MASLTLDICKDVYKAGHHKAWIFREIFSSTKRLEVYTTEILGFYCNGKYFTTSSLTVGNKTTMISLGIFVVLNSWLIYSFVFLFLDTKSAISKVFTINYKDIAALSDFALFQRWDPLQQR